MPLPMTTLSPGLRLRTNMHASLKPANHRFGFGDESVLFGHGAVALNQASLAAKKKKADMAEQPKVFGHVGLLFNKPPAGRAVVRLVVRLLAMIQPGMGHQ